MRSLLPLALCFAAVFPHGSWGQSESDAAGNEAVRKIMQTFKGRGVQRDNTPPTPAKESLKTFQMRDGFAIDLMAAEPDVEQPLYLSWDSRGRLWVTLYRQYQYPAGLKVMSYDQHLRAVFDKVPEPPPRGVKGADKVVVFEDTDGDGWYDRHKTVIEGLNIASAAIKGAGGIWVMNAPYLLFYPDANDDDIPDGDPQVMLSGFGLQDTHSVANSLRFGPDGWLYGANGSTTVGTVSSKVTKNVHFEGQHIWRFHPRTHVFEIYAEGGGNTFSTEIDAQGRIFSGTNGNQRGMHYEQGQSGVKAFGKHGPPLNPYAFGYFDHMVTKSDGKRFSQAFCIYDGGLMDEQLGGRIVAANSLQNLVYVSARVPDTSTFQAVDEAPLLRCGDRWFRPVDIKVGPDGAIYLADWYDTRLSHVSPVDDWSKTDGRIYRVRPAKAVPKLKPFDLHSAPVTELVAALDHPNKWFRQQAACELGWRGEKGVLPELEKRVRDPKNAHAFDALCALYVLGGFSDGLAAELLEHPDPYVRRWTVRCIGDAGECSTLLAAALSDLARRETHAEVRTQILASAKRLPTGAAMPIIRQMIERDTDLQDQRIPLLLWWAIEAKAVSNREELLAFFQEPAVWNHGLARDFGSHHLARRWATAGGPENYDACARLLALAPTSAARESVIGGLADAFVGAKVPELPPALKGPLDEYLRSRLDTDLALAVKTGNDDAIKKALSIVKDKKATLEKRVSLLEALADAGRMDVVPILLGILTESGSPALKRAVLPVAARFDAPKLAEAVVSGYEARFAGDRDLKDAAHRMLASRREWAQLLLAEVDAWRIKAADIAPDIVRQLAAFKDPTIDAMVQKHWKVGASVLTDAQKQSEKKRIEAVLRTGGGTVEKGHTLFAQRCAACHTLFTDGGKIGPDLTGYERTNVDFWLANILQPSLEIREGYGAYLAKLKNGQILSGILEKQDGSGISLKDLTGQSHRVHADEIDSLDALPVSLMPEGLLVGLSDEDLRDLFAYLMKP